MSGRRNPMAAADLQAAVDAVAAMPVREHTKEGVWRQVGALLWVSAGYVPRLCRQYGIACSEPSQLPPHKCPSCGQMTRGVRQYDSPNAGMCTPCQKRKSKRKSRGMR